MILPSLYLLCAICMFRNSLIFLLLLLSPSTFYALGGEFIICFLFWSSFIIHLFLVFISIWFLGFFYFEGISLPTFPQHIKRYVPSPFHVSFSPFYTLPKSLYTECISLVKNSWSLLRTNRWDHLIVDKSFTHNFVFTFLIDANSSLSLFFLSCDTTMFISRVVFFHFHFYYFQEICLCDLKEWGIIF